MHIKGARKFQTVYVFWHLKGNYKRLDFIWIYESVVIVVILSHLIKKKKEWDNLRNIQCLSAARNFLLYIELLCYFFCKFFSLSSFFPIAFGKCQCVHKRCEKKIMNTCATTLLIVVEHNTIIIYKVHT